MSESDATSLGILGKGIPTQEELAPRADGDMALSGHTGPESDRRHDFLPGSIIEPLFPAP